jgi:chromosome segregation ATPase
MKRWVVVGLLCVAVASGVFVAAPRGAEAQSDCWLMVGVGRSYANSLDTRVAALEDTVKSIRDCGLKHAEAIRLLPLTLSTLEMESHTHKSQLGRLESTVQDLETQVQNLERNVQDLKGQASTLTQQVQTLQERVEALAARQAVPRKVR